MYIEHLDDLYSGLVSQVELIIDLDRPEVELLKTDRSKYGVTNYPKCHVHDVFILNIDGGLFYAKGEDVYLKVSSRHSFNYNNFLEFALSIFRLDEGSVPARKFCFLDEPDVAEVNFEKGLVRRHLSAIKRITDDTRPGSIVDTKIRELFIFYLFKKERLVEKGGAVYDDVFNHHGRDIINEVLASVLGQLLGIPMPRNYFGHKRSQFERAFRNETHYAGPKLRRYVVSKAVQETHPSLCMVDVLNKKFRELNIVWGLSLYREQSNPLNLQFFQNQESANTQDFGNLIIAQCSHHTDLILSDFLDRLLDGSKDRKPYDYLLPSGLEGPIVTVDFGEILFPELMFDPDEPHYLQQKMARASAFREYFRQIGELSPDNLYRRTIADLVLKIRDIDLSIIRRLVEAIPETFLLDHLEDGQYCYQTATVIDFLENQFTIIMEQSDV